jgi:hypothetical protein
VFATREDAVSKIIYGFAALILTILKFAEAMPSLRRCLPIGGSFIYEVDAIVGPAVVLDQSIAWFQSCMEAHRKQRDRKRRAMERSLRRQREQQTKAA